MFTLPILAVVTGFCLANVPVGTLGIFCSSIAISFLQSQKKLKNSIYWTMLGAVASISTAVIIVAALCLI